MSLPEGNHSHVQHLDSSSSPSQMFTARPKIPAASQPWLHEKWVLWGWMDAEGCYRKSPLITGWWVQLWIIYGQYMVNLWLIYG